MRLTGIGLEQFRNLDTTRIEIPPEGAILIGENGQGKTNVLEAIHYLALFRSFRGTRHRDAIAFGKEHFRVEGAVAYETGRRRSVAVAADGSTRRIAIDGQTVARPADAVGTVITVLVGPDDLALVTGRPLERRRYLDATLGVASKRYWNALVEYDRVLRQRNELVRARMAPAEPLWESWDTALVAAGGAIVTGRAALVERLTAGFVEVAGQVAEGGERQGYALEYRPSVPVRRGEAMESAAVERAWLEALSQSRERDRERGWTTVGPHRDELAVRLAGRSVARFGSQGERRTAAIVLKLLALGILEADTGHAPILLLDDVFSELDRGRGERLVEWLGDRHQRFVTSPRPLPWIDGSLDRWLVDDGRIETSGDRAPPLAAGDAA